MAVIPVEIPLGCHTSLVFLVSLLTTCRPTLVAVVMSVVVVGRRRIRCLHLV